MVDTFQVERKKFYQTITCKTYDGGQKLTKAEKMKKEQKEAAEKLAKLKDCQPNNRNKRSKKLYHMMMRIKFYMVTLMITTLYQTLSGPRTQRNSRSQTPKKSRLKKKLAHQKPWIPVTCLNSSQMMKSNNQKGKSLQLRNLQQGNHENNFHIYFFKTLNFKIFWQQMMFLELRLA